MRAVEFGRSDCAYRTEFSAQSLCFRQRAARDNNRHRLRIIEKKLRQTATESSIAAEDQNFLHARRHGLLRRHCGHGIALSEVECRSNRYVHETEMWKCRVNAMKAL